MSTSIQIEVITAESPWWLVTRRGGSPRKAWVRYYTTIRGGRSVQVRRLVRFPVDARRGGTP